MRYLVEIGGLLLLIGVPAVIVMAFLRSGQQGPLTGRRREAALRRARWRAESQVLDDRTVVAIAKSIPAGGDREDLGHMVVAEIAATDPEWDVKVSQAMLDARVRAEILNQESGPALTE
jgi:hypothetical protein